MKITNTIRTALSRMSYTDIFALRFGAQGDLPAVEPCQARQSGLSRENRGGNEQSKANDDLLLHKYGVWII